MEGEPTDPRQALRSRIDGLLADVVSVYADRGDVAIRYQWQTRRLADGSQLQVSIDETSGDGPHHRLLHMQEVDDFDDWTEYDLTRNSHLWTYSPANERLSSRTSAASRREQRDLQDGDLFRVAELLSEFEASSEVTHWGISN